ncbi:MAG: adenylosuccinate synthetase [Actinobacteria bacterium]|nr:adenylosuccinate synthetase [Actinomycetota bacterium]
MNELADEGYGIIVEGTQGIGLSLHHSECFPYATSRDTSAAAFLSEVGLSPLLVKDILLVLRTFPIRVAGNSGPLAGEITWEELSRRSRSPEPLVEFTTVTQKVRRVAEFDWDLAHRAVRISRPTGLAIHGLDYLNSQDRSARSWNDISAESKHFVHEMEARLQVPVHFVFTGSATTDLVDRRLMQSKPTDRKVVEVAGVQ